MSTEDGDYTIQKSDVYYEGSTADIYSLSYYLYNYVTDGAVSPTLSGQYKTLEESYRKYVYNNYLWVDDSTKAYLSELIKKQGFNINSPTIIADIASYIQNAATYNLDYDTALDDESDIVVAFLETYKEGICQHYASAATLLFRTLGIPARYTGGYTGTTKAGAWSEITTNQAHAWVEVYLDGIGWVQVEVTGSGSLDGDGNLGGGDLDKDDGTDGSSNGDLDLSGNIGVSDDESNININTVALKVYSDKSGTIYLKIKSFGDFVNNQLQEMSPYTVLIDGKYSMDYLTGIVLSQNGYTANDIKIEVNGTGYYLPYYMSTEGGDYTVQTSDVYYEGDASVIYSLSYYLYNYVTDGAVSSTLSGQYKTLEESYRKYVYNNYLWVDDSTKAYLLQLINKQGFNASSPTIIADVASYIQNAATYNMEYDKALDKESNLVIAFLETYKEGICQHYAISATQLFRTLGIPARYVKGYTGTTTAGEWTEIKVAQAHAWVEVYLDGIGWVQVEVTGGGSSSGDGIGGVGGTGGSGDLDIGDGYMENDPQAVTFEPETTYVKYEEGMQPATALQAIKGFNKLKNDGYTYDVVIEGSSTEPGVTYSKITKLIIYDSQGIDVTDTFKITLKEGEIRVYLAELNITTDSASKVYDGTPLTCQSFTYGALLEGHKIESYTMSSSITNAGEVRNKIKLKIVDSNGNDVTDYYKLNITYGKLEVTPRNITITSQSAEKAFDGTELVCDEFTYDETSLASGHKVVVKITGKQTSMGQSTNTIESIKIYDEDGNDVTSNYKIDVIEGELRVYFKK
jgi:transglutaminase-like putative cysteine protease/uncharacterized protein YnzC (UPF0291/DUF896 family)